MRTVIKCFVALIISCSFLSCEKENGDDLKGYWMSERNFYDCKRVYYFDGKGGGLLYSYLSTDPTSWDMDCECHRYNTEYVGNFNGVNYYKQKDAGMNALIYTIAGSSIVVSTSNGESLEYLNYSNGTIAGYKKVTKK